MGKLLSAMAALWTADTCLTLGGISASAALGLCLVAVCMGIAVGLLVAMPR